MDILPLISVREEDAPLVGANIVNLAKLAQAGVPVSKGVVVLPPDFRLRTLLEHFNLKDREIFEQTLTVLRKEIKKVTPPQELKNLLKKNGINSASVWDELLQIWLEEIRKKIWQGGLGSGVTLGLSAQPIFFIKKIQSSGKAWYDPASAGVVFELDKGNPNREELKDYIERANKILFLPQVYYWIEARGKLAFVKVLPYTPSPTQSPSMEDLLERKSKKESPKERSAIKILLDCPPDLTVDSSLDGCLIRGESFGQTSERFDHLVFKLVETAESFSNKPVIFRLSDRIETFGGVRGSLRLIHQQALLRQEVEGVLFARHKKGLLNIQIGIPFVRSVNEFLQMKRDLASMGASRKGTLKLWLEAGVPENLINIADYLVAGLDGVIINLDELSSWLGGFDHHQPEAVFYKKQISALVSFLEDPLRLIHKSQTTVVFSGELALEDEMLKLIVGGGIWGVLVAYSNSLNLTQHLRYMEKRHLSN